MSMHKQKIFRYCLINQAINTLPDPTFQKILMFVSKGLPDKINYISASTMDKDLKDLRKNWNVPLIYNKKTGHYEYSDPNFEWWKSFLKYWAQYVEFPDQLIKLTN